jgi:hypothetical protein
LRSAPLLAADKEEDVRASVKRAKALGLGFLLLAGLVLAAPALAATPAKNAKPRKDWRQVLSEAKQQPPTIYETEVREWFKTVKFSGYRQESLFNEFHPDDGNLVAIYKNGSKLLYVSYVDHKRMSPFGFKRSAKEMVTNGGKRLAQTYDVKGWKWYGDATSKPIVAADVSPTIKVVLLGYSGLSLGDLQKLAEDVPLDPLAKQAKN